MWGLRLPWVLLGALVGAGLAVVGTAGPAGAGAQPPGCPVRLRHHLGRVGSGATAVLVFGVTILGRQSVSVAAFLGVVVAFALVLLLARLGGGISPTRLIRAGVAVAYTMSALTSFLVFMARSTSDQGLWNRALADASLVDVQAFSFLIDKPVPPHRPGTPSGAATAVLAARVGRPLAA